MHQAKRCWDRCEEHLVKQEKTKTHASTIATVTTMSVFYSLYCNDNESVFYSLYGNDDEGLL